MTLDKLGNGQNQANMWFRGASQHNSTIYWAQAELKSQSIIINNNKNDKNYEDQ